VTAGKRRETAGKTGLRGAPRIAVFVAAALALALSGFAAVRFATFLSVAYGGDSPLAEIGIPSGPLPLRLTVYGRGIDTLSMRLGFLDPSGDSLGTIERSLNGWELTIDTITVGTGSGWLVFPFRLYTDAVSPARGIDLIRYYDRDGFPALWDEKALSPREARALRAVFSVARTERWMPRFLGSLHHERLVIRNFEAGSEYAVSILPDGSLELLLN